jgi:hypothetical protein
MRDLKDVFHDIDEMLVKYAPVRTFGEEEMSEVIGKAKILIRDLGDILRSEESIGTMIPILDKIRDCQRFIVDMCMDEPDYSHSL